jgi:hypothetical protein
MCAKVCVAVSTLINFDVVSIPKPCTHAWSSGASCVPFSFGLDESWKPNVFFLLLIRFIKRKIQTIYTPRVFFFVIVLNSLILHYSATTKRNGASHYGARGDFDTYANV